MSATRTGLRCFRHPLVLGATVGLGLVVLFVTHASRGEPPSAGLTSTGRKTEVEIIDEVTRATDKALDYLEKVQVKDGPQAGAWHQNQAMNALAILAYLSSGHVPGRGKYGDVIEDGVVKPGVLTRGRKYMLSVAAPTGFLGTGSMYEHGLATLALAELYGMDPDEDVEKKLRLAIDLIVKTQSAAGGWRYSPVPGDQDMSVTVMQIVALRAANNAEVPVPATTFERAIKYVQSCGAATGGYGYTGAGQSPQTSAGGALSMQLLGKADDANVPRTIAYLQTIPIVWGPGGVQYFYYFHYYGIQAHYQHGGKEWNEWHPKVRDMLLWDRSDPAHPKPRQNADGSWDVPAGTAEAAYATAENKVYSTAIATLILNIYKHYLPAYQR